MRGPVWVVDVSFVEVGEEGSSAEEDGWKAQDEDTN